MPTDRFKESAYAPETDDVWLLLVVLEHPDLTDPIRVANNLEDVVSNGETFTACPFDFTLPSSLEDSSPRARIRLPNVSKEVIKAVREIDSPASISFMIVLGENPDLVEFEYRGMTLTEVTADAGTISGDVGFEDIRLEPFPSHGFNPSYFRSM